MRTLQKDYNALGNPVCLADLIHYTMKECNIVPLTSRCDARCVFCSHRNNPPEINVYSIGEVPFTVITESLKYIDPQEIITIGESATTIIEGEPMLHSKFMEILTHLRTVFPHTPISVTTNGHHLTEEVIRKLKALDGIMLNVSLNSSTIKGRKVLMGDDEKTAERTLDGIRLLAGHGMTYYASLVAMPHLTGFADLEETISFLDENKAKIIRVFLPGFSSFCRNGAFDRCRITHEELKQFIDDSTRKTDIRTPVLLEPSLVTDLTPVVSGVICKSAPSLAGLRKEDVILSVNGYMPKSRTDAWNAISRLTQIQATVNRNGKIMDFFWTNTDCSTPGVILESDFDMRRAERIKSVMCRQKGHGLILCSEFAYEMMKEVLKRIFVSGLQVPLSRRPDCENPFIPALEVHPEVQYTLAYVKNITFGGSIKAAGLLTIKDYEQAFDDYVSDCAHPKADYILVPEESFNYMAFDLSGRYYRELGKYAGNIPVFPV